MGYTFREERAETERKGRERKKKQETDGYSQRERIAEYGRTINEMDRLDMHFKIRYRKQKSIKIWPRY